MSIPKTRPDRDGVDEVVFDPVEIRMATLSDSLSPIRCELSDRLVVEILSVVGRSVFGSASGRAKAPRFLSACSEELRKLDMSIVSHFTGAY